MADLRTTTQLIERLSSGDHGAREELIERYLPRLRRWAHGRLPRHGRDLSETDDLVQITLLRALNNLERFEARRPGAFLAYLRTILMNQVREELRKHRRRPEHLPLTDSQIIDESSPVEDAVGRETMQAYEAALARLPEDKRAAVIMRVEFDLSYDEIARELERPSANAARMMVVRALQEIAERLGHE